MAIVGGDKMGRGWKVGSETEGIHDGKKGFLSVAVVLFGSNVFDEHSDGVFSLDFLPSHFEEFDPPKILPPDVHLIQRVSKVTVRTKLASLVGRHVATPIAHTGNYSLSHCYYFLLLLLHDDSNNESNWIGRKP